MPPANTSHGVLLLPVLGNPPPAPPPEPTAVVAGEVSTTVSTTIVSHTTWKPTAKSVGHVQGCTVPGVAVVSHGAGCGARAKPLAGATNNVAPSAIIRIGPMVRAFMVSSRSPCPVPAFGEPYYAPPVARDTPPHERREDQALVHRAVDGWLLGGAGILAWFAVSKLPWVGGPLLGPLDGRVVWVLLALASAHFGASYHLAYGEGRAAVRSHPVWLIAAPATLLAAVVTVVVLVQAGAVGSGRWLVRALLVLVFSTTGWHYIKQAYGVAMLSLKLRGIRVPRTVVRALRYGFYPIWIVDLMDVWAQGHRASYRRYDIGVALLPRWVEQAARGVAGSCVVAVVVLLVVLAARQHRRPPMGAWAPYVVGGLWFVLPPTYISAAAVIGATHSVQYLACVHRAEVQWGRERGEANLVHWWLCVFGGATAGGLLVGSWLPDVLGRATPGLALPGLAGTLLFVALNLHHYAIDASVWRSRGDHIRRIVTRPQTVPSVTVGSVGATATG